MDNQLTVTSKLAIIIQQGRVLDFIDGRPNALKRQKNTSGRK
jgi:hypothetical protein